MLIGFMEIHIYQQKTYVSAEFILNRTCLVTKEKKSHKQKL